MYVSRDKITFGNKSDEFFELSPWYFCTFNMYGKKYRTLIHFWAACTLDEGQREYIRNAGEPLEAVRRAKMLGVSNFQGISKEVVLKSIYERFVQNTGIISTLLCTGECELVYRNSDYGISRNNEYGRVLEGLRRVFLSENN